MAIGHASAAILAAAGRTLGGALGGSHAATLGEALGDAVGERLGQKVAERMGARTPSVRWLGGFPSELSAARAGLDSGAMERNWLLEYRRNPEAYRAIVCEGPELEPIRAALVQAGYSWYLEEQKTKIFVHPW